MNDPIQFAKQVADLVRDQVMRATAPLLERLATLESRPEPVIGKDGTSVTVEDVLPTLLAAIPEPVPGPPGDGVTLEQVLAAIPTPKDGTGVTLDEVLAALTPHVDETLAAIPTPKDGASVSLDDVKGLVESNMAGWALDFERRAQDLFQRTIDRMPKPKDGRDAFDLDDLDLSLDEDGRTVRLRFMRGTDVREKTVTLSTLLDRGVYKAGQSYEKGDGVSWGGSFFIAQKETTALPDQSDEWRLAVKRGRDGNRGRDASTKAPEPYRSRL